MTATKDKYKLAKHQVYASEMMDNCYQLGIFYEAGCGKTMCVLDWLYQSFKRGEIENALVICPASIVSNWESSIDKMAQFEGYTNYGIQQLHKLVTIRSYQKTYEKKQTQIRHRDGTVETIKPLRIRSDIHHEWGAIIIDESQGLGSHSSIQTKICLQLANLTERRYILSGTPVSGGGGGEDYKKLYGQLKFLNPEIWKNWTEFCTELVRGYDFYGNPDAYDNEKCRELLHNYGIVARLNDCYDMPGMMDIPIPLDCAVPTDYKEIQKGNTAKYNIDLKTGGGYFIKLLELVSGFLKDDDGNIHTLRCGKPAALDDVLTSTDDKVVVFCNYTHSIDSAATVCRAHGKTVVFDGRSTRDTWRDFQEGDAKYLVCQYQSGGVGIDLYASHTMVFYEPSLSSLLTEQAKARIHRKGQEEKCLYYWFSTKGTLEEKVVQTVQRGVDVTRDMLDKWARTRKI